MALSSVVLPEPVPPEMRMLSLEREAIFNTVASASGELSYPTVTFTNGSDMDSWAEGEAAIVRIRRKHDDAGDTASGDAELLGFIGKET